MRNEVTIALNHDVADKQGNIFPQNANEIIDWAKKYGLVNSYETLSNERIVGDHDLGKFQKQLFETLIAGEKPSLEKVQFMQKIQAATNIIQSLNLDVGLKKTIIETLVTDETPRLHDLPFNHTIKKISLEEIIPGEKIQVHQIDSVGIGGFSFYGKPHDPKEVYEHCIDIRPFTSLEKKLIALAVDKKPRRTNYSLFTRTANQINEIVFNRKGGRVELRVGKDEIYDSFRIYHFLHMIFDNVPTDELHEIYALSEDEKKAKIENSDWFKNFKPDFESEK